MRAGKEGDGMESDRPRCGADVFGNQGEGAAGGSTVNAGESKDLFEDLWWEIVEVHYGTNESGMVSTLWRASPVSVGL